jgi:hypothetical protein
VIRAERARVVMQHRIRQLKTRAKVKGIPAILVDIQMQCMCMCVLLNSNYFSGGNGTFYLQIVRPTTRVRGREGEGESQC